jgi:hypothetical protein
LWLTRKRPSVRDALEPEGPVMHEDEKLTKADLERTLAEVEPLAKKRGIGQFVEYSEERCR